MNELRLFMRILAKAQFSTRSLTAVLLRKSNFVYFALYISLTHTRITLLEGLVDRFLILFVTNEMRLPVVL